MIKSVIASVAALLFAAGLVFAQPKEELKTEAPKVEAPKAAPPEKAVAPPESGDAKKPAEFQPEVGQAGKDVIWVPTPQNIVDGMLNMADAKPGDYVIDLGSGDGRTVITAAKRGIKALGIEYNPDMVELSRRNAAKEGVADRAAFVQGDIFKTDFSKATVLTLYLLPRLNLALRPTILKMKPGTRVASHSFTMDDWQPDDGINSAGEKCREHCSAYFWVVPARVSGGWRTAHGTLRLRQKFQMFTGTLKSGGRIHKIEDGRVRGETFTFTAGGRKYEGTVKGKKMTVKAG
jgi:SAM-dependent methyltransferase